MKEKDRLIYKILNELNRNNESNYVNNINKVITKYEFNLEELLKLDLDEIL